MEKFKEIAVDAPEEIEEALEWWIKNPFEEASDQPLIILKLQLLI